MVEDTVGQVAAAVPVPAAVTSPEVEAEVTSEIEEQAERVLPMPPMMFFTARIEQPGDVHTIKRDQEETVTPGDEESGTVTVRKVVHTNERVVRNPEEREKGRKLISSMYSRLGRLGSKVGNCYLVPLKHKVKALAEIAAVRREAAVFNSTATHHYIRSVITTPMEVVASDEGLYARDVALKMQEITGQIKDALEACDVNKVRNLASEAATVVRIIGNGDAAKMEQMISSARAGANWINRELKKKEKDISEIRAEIKGSAVAAVESARLAFLEYAQPEEVKAIGSALGAAQMDLEVSEPAAEVQQVNNSDDGRFDL